MMQLIWLKQIRHCDKNFHFTQFSAEILRVMKTALLSKRVLFYTLIVVAVTKHSVRNNKDFTKRLKRLKDITAICIRMKPIYGYATDK
jgi:hypothetical protein